MRVLAIDTALAALAVCSAAVLDTE